MVVNILILSSILSPGLQFQNEEFDTVNATWKGNFVIKNVTVVPMGDREEGQWPNCDVWITDGWISRIDRQDSLKKPLGPVALPSKTTVIEGRNRYLIPGLIDSHTHIWMGDGRFPDFGKEDMWLLFLANGVTTVTEMIGANLNNTIRWYLFDWRAEIEQGQTVGPTLFVGSPRFRDEYHPNAETIDRAVKEYAEAGYDFIKVHAPNSPANYERLFEQAAINGIHPVGHPPFRSPVPFETVLKLQTMICHTGLIYRQAYGEHTDFLDSAQIAYVADQVALHDNWIQPTLAINRLWYYHSIDEYWEERSMSPWLRYFPSQVVDSWVNHNNVREANLDAEHFRRRRDTVEQLTFAFYQRGVRLLAGTDAGGIDMTPYGFMMVEELQSFQNEVGLRPWDALMTATTNNAEWLGMDEIVGSVDVGKRADLVLLEEDPLQDTAAVSQIAGIFVRGRWMPKKVLDAALDELAERVSVSGKSAPRNIPLDVHCDHEMDLISAGGD